MYCTVVSHEIKPNNCLHAESVKTASDRVRVEKNRTKLFQSETTQILPRMSKKINNNNNTQHNNSFLVPTFVSWSRLFSRKEIFCFCAREPPCSSTSSPAAERLTLVVRSIEIGLIRLTIG